MEDDDFETHDSEFSDIEFTKEDRYITRDKKNKRRQLEDLLDEIKYKSDYGDYEYYLRKMNRKDELDY